MKRAAIIFLLLLTGCTAHKVVKCKVVWTNPVTKTSGETDWMSQPDAEARAAWDNAKFPVLKHEVKCKSKKHHDCFLCDEVKLDLEGIWEAQ